MQLFFSEPTTRQIAREGWWAGHLLGGIKITFLHHDIPLL